MLKVRQISWNVGISTAEMWCSNQFLLSVVTLKLRHISHTGKETRDSVTETIWNISDREIRGERDPNEILGYVHTDLKYKKAKWKLWKLRFQ
jgi:hypothetical protein